VSVLEKLAQFKAVVEGVKKNGTNPFHKSKYATLESVIDTIKEPCAEVKLGYYQTTTAEGLETVIYDVEDDKSQIKGFLPFIGATDMQKLGSSVTYNRRYSLVTMFGLEQEDDDGNKASGYTKQPVKPEPKISNNQVLEIEELIVKHGKDRAGILKQLRIKDFGEINLSNYGKMIAWISAPKK